MKTALIQPPGNPFFRVPPLGLCYLAAVLREKEFKVKIFDLNLENASLGKLLSHERLEIVGVSCVISNALHALEITRKMKILLP